MKELAFVISILALGFCNLMSQVDTEPIQIEDRGYFQNEMQLNVKHLKTILESNSEAYEIFIKSKRQVYSGIAFIGLGGGWTASNSQRIFNNDDNDNPSTWAILAPLPLLVGGWMLVYNASNLMESSIEIYNSGLTNQTGFLKNYEVEISPTKYGIGLVLRF